MKLDKDHIELRDLLLEEHSKKQVFLISDLIEKKPPLFKKLVELALVPEKKYPQRASWTMEELVIRNPNWILPYIEEITLTLPHLLHDGNRRNLVKILSRTELPKDNLGMLLNICFDWVMDFEKAIAVKIHCITVLERICKIEKDLIPELKAVLQEIQKTGSNGIKSKCRHTLIALEKLQPE
ncbi:MAG: hypothetical protein ACPGD5_08125 [Salibacteraceae bacterium]